MSFEYDFEQNYDFVLYDYGCIEVSAMELYSDIFQLGYGVIQKSGEYNTHKANPIALGSWDGKIKRRIMLDDTFEEQLQDFQQADWAVLNGLTYWGKSNTANNQAYLHALMFDLDGITVQSLINFLYAAHGDAWDGHGAYPIPNYIIRSGENVHLYYVFEEPVPLYPKAKQELKKLKYALTRIMWNPHTSEIKTPQYQGLNQGFRIVGGKTKNGGRVRAYKLNLHPFCIDELNDYVSDENKADIKEPKQSKLTLEQAKIMYPEWYERVVVNGEKPITVHNQTVWKVKEDLYNWWLRKLQNSDGVTYGHRYFCVMALAIFAAKCGITNKKRVKQDAINLIPTFNQINEDEPFTQTDINSALDCLDLRYTTFPRADIEKLTAILMPANKRNFRKQELHMQIMTAIRDTIYPNGEWRDGNGRKPKKQLVLDYAKEHPTANHSQIARELNISRPTVIKWLKTSV